VRVPILTIAVLGTVALLNLATATPASAQAVAFQPVVNSFPSGVQLWTQPVVSADRRYVRLGVNPLFTDLLGFDAFSVPAAVSGGGVGGGAGGGLGGIGGGGGGAGGGGGGAVGARFMAGVNGVEGLADGSSPSSGTAMGIAPYYSPYAYADASSALSGAGGLPARPRLSDGMGAYDPTPRAKAKSRKAKVVRSKKR
jgi:hypothetical protein